MLLDQGIKFNYVLKKIKVDIIIVAAVGLLTHFLTSKTIHLLPEMPLGIPAFLGTAISVLLSFKMNQSYDRWWEARKVWGAIVNDSRSLVVQLRSLIQEDETFIKRVAYRQIAWCYSLGQSLRGLDPLQNINHLLSSEDFTHVQSFGNKPLALIDQHAKDIKLLKQNKRIETFTQIQFDNTFIRLCDSMGKAERINTTIFPSTYRYFLHFIIYVFVITLSISLRQVDLIFELPLLLVISSCFFLIEKSAYHLQDPFKNRPSDISVTAIARNIEINIRQLLGETSVPEPVKPEKFYIL